MPGPGQYNVRLSYIEQSPKRFSLRPKTSQDTSFQNYTKFVPGPGAYNLDASNNNQKGYVVNSKYKSAGGVVISRSGKRFDNTRIRNSMQIPGPANYQPKLELNNKGQYTFYKFKNSGAPVFPKSVRSTNLDNSVTRKSK